MPDSSAMGMPPSLRGDRPGSRASAPRSPSVSGDGWPADLLTLYHERWVTLTRLAFVLTGDRAVAEDLVQDVFVRARGRWAQIDEPAAYLRTAVVNATRDWARRAAVAERHRPRSAPPAVDHPDEVWDALARLDHRRRAAIVLRFYDDLPDAEIAALLHCRPATVRTLVHRGLRDLRRELRP